MTRTLNIILSLVLMMLNIACSSSEPVSREDQRSAAFADLRSAITEIVTDQGRQADVVAVIDSLEKDVDELWDLLVRRRTELRKLNADYDATREEFLEFANQMESRIQNSRRQALQQHLRLAAAMTADEWAAIEKAQTRAMRSIAGSVQGI
jgi:septal ring factor EnvC (AmiA/AmiB activator)